MTQGLLARRFWRGLIAGILCTALAACGGGGGGFSADGGVSGTGLSAVTGNVTNVVGGDDDVSGIRVIVEGTDIETVTDDDGGFTLTGDFEGPVTVVFELDDGGRAETTVDVPTGGSVDLENVTLDTETEQAVPTRETIELEGHVESVDCPGSVLVVRAGAGRFTVALEQAFLHDAAGSEIRCTAIARGDTARVLGEVLDDGRIGNADVEITSPQPTTTPTPARPTPTPTARDAVSPRPSLDAPRATATPRIAISPARTLDAPRPTPTTRDSDRPRPTETVPNADRPRPTPTATSDVQPLPIATARVAPRPAP